jgi:hypothetical protein
MVFNGEWYFSMIDVIEVLSGSTNPRRYWSDLKFQVCNHEGFIQLYEKIVQLKFIAFDGKMRNTDTASTETIFRLLKRTFKKNANKFNFSNEKYFPFWYSY